MQSDLLHKYQSKDDILILTVRLAVIVAVILTVPVLFFTVSNRPRGPVRKAEVSPVAPCLEPAPQTACGRELPRVAGTVPRRHLKTLGSVR